MLGFPSAERRRRYREVSSALARHGMGALAARLGLERIAPFRSALSGDALPEPDAAAAAHLRLALEELGTTPIKLGQILATRPDLVPFEYVSELEKLHDRVPPVPADDIIAIIERELERRLGAVFSEFDREPLAAASIGQVHAARLCDGTAVVVKVRKPGVTESVAVDLSILSDLARRAARVELFGGTYDVEGIVDDFAWTLRAELDYVREGRNAERLRAILADDPRVVIPNIHWDVTTEAVLVMDHIEGVRIGDVERLDEIGVQRARIARISAEILMKQVFEVGFFHADPHPGNFLVLGDGRIALLDFGMVGQLSEELRHSFLQLFVATIQQDASAITDEMEMLGILRSISERDAVRRDVQHVLNRYYGLAVDEFSLSEYINDVLSVVRRHALQLPADLALLLKTVAMSEGLWRRLDPHFNASRVSEPFVQRALRQMYAPQAWGRRLLRAAEDTVELGAYLPGQVRRIFARLDRGEFQVTLRHQELDEALNRLSSMVTRISVAVVMAAFIVGLPLIANTWEPPGWDYIAPIWFFAGLVALAALLARWLLARRR